MGELQVLPQGYKETRDTSHDPPHSSFSSSKKVKTVLPHEFPASLRPSKGDGSSPSFLKDLVATAIVCCHQLTHPSACEWTSEMWCKFTVGYSSGIKGRCCCFHNAHEPEMSSTQASHDLTHIRTEKHWSHRSVISQKGGCRLGCLWAGRQTGQRLHDDS